MRILQTKLIVNKYCNVVRNSFLENEIAIKLLYDNSLYKKAIGTLREELDLYIRTLYLLNRNDYERELLISDFINHKRWKNVCGKYLSDHELVEYANRITGFGWEQISYRFSIMT